jgi:alpha-glucosidase
MAMRKSCFFPQIILAFLLLFTTACQPSQKVDAVETITSPDGTIKLTFTLDNGTPTYQIDKGDQSVITPSRLGFEFKDAAPLKEDFRLIKAKTTSYDKTWTQPWGEVKDIREHYNQLEVTLGETTPESRVIGINFRVFDDGVGFRYEFPEQDNLADFEIFNELTTFTMAGDYESWWIPAFWDNRYEYLYQNTPISEIKSDQVSAVHTPFTMASSNGLYLTIHEAALADYASMALKVGKDTTLECELFPWYDGTKVKATTPHKTPWRTIQIAEKPGDLITSYLILNLNEPNRLEDISWIKPGKYIGIWWGMHIGTFTWGSGPIHGATTENAFRYIDFAAENGFDGVLIEGWNLGWDGDWTANGHKFSFTEPYPDFDLQAVARYAEQKGVKLIGHHETGAAIKNFEDQMDDAFVLYQTLGVNTVKTGYVGWGQGIKRFNELSRFRGVEWHHGQYMVEHYRKVIETAAQYGIMLDVHEPIKDTGERRTYPNMMTREGARGQEYNAWSEDGGNPPDHTTILPFTRMMAGPFDLTPGTFDILISAKPNNRVNTTLAKQLALYVVIYSPLHMASDLPENYIDQPAFQFIRDVPTDWQDTRVLDAVIGDTVTIVRQERNSNDWFLGSITDENDRTIVVPLDFLESGTIYVAEIYADGPGANWLDNPLSIDINNVLVESSTRLILKLAPGGGTAVRFRSAKPSEIDTLPFYTP